MNNLLKGALAGFIATAPMTLSMVGMFRMLPRRQQYRLPPRQITMRVLGTPEVRRNAEEPERTNLTLLSHFGYGAAAGAVYAPVAALLRPPALSGGVAHGLAVWSASYLALLPSLRILTPATRHPAARNALMIAAHVVWGATTGVILEKLLREEEQVAGRQPRRDRIQDLGTEPAEEWQQPLGQIH